jgi:outer membrane lipoprotein-sorting protein
VKAAFLLFAATLAAQPVPEALTAKLKATAVLHADFTQTRRIAALSRPLKSTGTFVVARGQGVLWRMAKPLPLTIVAGPKGILEVDPQGRKKVTNAQDSPMAGRMAGIMKSLLEGDLNALGGLFTPKAEMAADGAWTLELAPRPQTAAFIKSVRIQGAAFVERILITEASGDSTELVFSRFRPEAPLEAEERKLLAFE